LGAASAFRCFRCGREKKSKLVAVFRDDWNHLLCNGCYGFLLSVIEIKAGDASTTERAQLLGELLPSLVPDREARAAEEHLAGERVPYPRSNTARSRVPDQRRVRGSSLEERYRLDWSSAVIGLCKTCEVELNERLVEPLAKRVAGLDLLLRPTRVRILCGLQRALTSSSGKPLAHRG
jgi:hypothetical protein